MSNYEYTSLLTDQMIKDHVKELLQEANKQSMQIRYKRHRSGGASDMKVYQTNKKMENRIITQKIDTKILNKFSINQGNNFLRAEGWCPTSAQDIIREMLNDVTVIKVLLHKY